MVSSLLARGLWALRQSELWGKSSHRSDDILLGEAQSWQECPSPFLNVPGGEGLRKTSWLVGLGGYRVSSARLGIVRRNQVVLGFVFCCLLVFAFYVEKLQAQQGDKIEDWQDFFMTFSIFKILAILVIWSPATQDPLVIHLPFNVCGHLPPAHRCLEVKYSTLNPAPSSLHLNFLFSPS